MCTCALRCGVWDNYFAMAKGKKSHESIIRLSQQIGYGTSRLMYNGPKATFPASLPVDNIWRANVAANPKAVRLILPSARFTQSYISAATRSALSTLFIGSSVILLHNKSSL